MKFVLLYLTAANQTEARRLAKVLLQERLVACVNIVGPILSRYWWQGKLTTSREVLVLAKTRAALAQSVIRKVQTLHSYDVPCVVALPIIEGNPAFLRWIGTETKTKSR